jgi:hypothetical protein
MPGTKQWHLLPNVEMLRWCSTRVERGLQPLHTRWLYQDHIKPARRHMALAGQVVPRRKNDAPLFDKTNACCRPSMGSRCSAAHFYKHRGTVGRSHDEVNFPASAARGSIIALQKAQAVLDQVAQSLVFGCIAGLFGRGGFVR